MVQMCTNKVTKFSSYLHYWDSDLYTDMISVGLYTGVALGYTLALFSFSPTNFVF